MAPVSSLSDPKAYHILTYGTLLGSNIFQTFLAGPVAFKALPRPSFSVLQQAIFPPYFTFQTALPLVLALTWPGEKIAAAGRAVARQNSGLAGLLEEEHRWTAFAPIFAMFATSFLNLLVLGPATTKVMKERKHQETREGKRYYDPGPKSAEMQRLNSSFGKLHGASSLSNVIGLGAMIWYGFVLAEKL
ncbi:hypothetical protein CKM354_000307800 [Cercospora kikuchii]|uniref:TMEM205-like domain-containing protein n=1 Tax=Cercospora kikuchii TaxID=84275 RepID=A0A9P3FEN7_9PEZI|nr:uncharacterized protein CKM354_000307800 [Cercospora kikuchii]GIZ39705.1 hypothetical protein CKM354_000307800 [Cercospora kikuchii]